MNDPAAQQESKGAKLLISSAALQTVGVVLISIGFFADVASLFFFGGTGLILLIVGDRRANLRAGLE